MILLLVLLNHEDKLGEVLLADGGFADSVVHELALRIKYGNQNRQIFTSQLNIFFELCLNSHFSDLI